MKRRVHNKINQHSRFLITGRLLPSPIRNLSSITHKSCHGHTRICIHGMYPSTSRLGHEHTINQWLLDTEYYPISASQPQGRTGILHGLGGIFNLKDPSIWAKC